MYEFLEYQVRDVMSEPVTVEPQTALSEAERLFEDNGYNALPVIEPDGRLVGLITSLDLLRAFVFTDDSMFPPYETIMSRPVVRIMSLDVQTVTPRAPLTRVLQKLCDTRNKSFPVVDDDRLVGIVSRGDVMRALRRADSGKKPNDRD